jgi:hypothetical protein
LHEPKHISQAFGKDTSGREKSTLVIAAALQLQLNPREDSELLQFKEVEGNPPKH